MTDRDKVDFFQNGLHTPFLEIDVNLWFEYGRNPQSVKNPQQKKGNGLRSRRNSRQIVSLITNWNLEMPFEIRIWMFDIIYFQRSKCQFWLYWNVFRTCF